MAGRCGQLEAIGRAGSIAGADELMAQLEPEIARAVAELEKYRKP